MFNCEPVFITKLLLGAFLIHCLFKFIIYIWLGVSFSYLNIFTFKAYGISYETDEASVLIDKIGFKFSIFNKSKKNIIFKVYNLTVDLTDYKLKCQLKSENVEFVDDKETEDRLKIYKFDPDEPVGIYPKNKRLQRLLKTALPSSPISYLKISNVKILCTKDLHILISNIQAKTDINTSKTRKPLVGNHIKKAESNFWFSNLIFENAVLCDSTTNQVLSTFFETANISIGFEINIRKGLVNKFDPYLRLKGTDFSMLYLVKLISSFKSDYSCHLNGTSSESPKITKKQMYRYGFIYRILNCANISVQFFKISEIPIVSKEKLFDFVIQGEENYDNVLFSSVELGSFNFNVQKMMSNQVGFNLKYVDGSFPVAWLISFTGLRFRLDFSAINNYTGKTKIFEIIVIPNLLLNVESTMFINLLRVVFNHDDFTLSQRQSVFDFQCSITNLTIDISAEQLGIFITKVKEISNFLRKTAKPDHTTQKWTIVNRIKVLKKKYTHFFFDTFPKWSFKVLLEKPTFIIKSENEQSNPDKNDMHLVILSPSLINAELNIRTTQKIVNFDTRLDVPNFLLTYQRNSMSNAQNFATLRDGQYKTSFSLEKSSNFESYLNLSFLEFDLSNIVTLNGLNVIIRNFLQFVCDQREEQISCKESFSETKVASENNNTIQYLFKELPSWFKRFSFGVGNIRIKLGAKSIFMPANLVVDESVFNKVTHNAIKGDSPSVLIFTVSRIDAIIKNNDPAIVFDDSNSSNTSENSRNPEDCFWMCTNKVEGVRIISETGTPGGKIIKEKILNLPIVDTNLYATREKKFEFNSFISTLNIFYSITSHFTLFSSLYLLRNTLGMALNSHNHETKEAEKKRVGSVFDLFCFKLFLKELQIKLLLATDFHLRLDIFGSRLIGIKNPVYIEQKFIRMAVKKTQSSEYYHKFMAFENMEGLIFLPTTSNGPRVSFNNSNIKICIPSNFVVHNLFDAIKLSFKLTKQMVHNLKTNTPIERPSVELKKPIKLPDMKFKSESLSFAFEDDPFEANLGMIYQLGRIEQESRLAKMTEFEKYVNNIKKYNGDEEIVECLHSDDHYESCKFKKMKVKDLLDEIYNLQVSDVDHHRLVGDCARKLHKVRNNISKSWVYLINEFRIKRRKTVEINAEFLTGSLSAKLPVSKKFNSKLFDFNENPPLMVILFTDFVLSIDQPTFAKDSHDFKSFIRRVGKGIPYETTYSILIPMHLTLKSSEARVHLRDYPLPLVYIPCPDNSGANDTFVMEGDVIVIEPMASSKKEYWYKYIPMFQGLQKGANDKYFSWAVATTICTVKTLYEMDLSIDTDKSTMVTWSKCYSPVLRQLTISFDSFSKLTRDPSKKLGVWDKMRNILHGYLKIKWINSESEVQLNVPNAMDPYKLMTSNSGFSLVFKNNIVWSINDPEREFERDYFIFRAESVWFAIPNFLSTPLPCWCSNKLIFLASKPNDVLVSSMFGYYINPDYYYDPNSEMANILEITEEHRFKITNIELTGDIEIKLSMLFERQLSDGTRTSKFKPHYDNKLCNPDFVDDLNNFDSYEGFRSQFIHMAFTLTTKNSSRNSLRLTPRSVKHFRKWFKRFSNGVSPPIKNGPLWDEHAKSVKFGSHLFTFKFLFLVQPLYIFHGYRVDLSNPSNNSLIGLKAKISKFTCDLHERKEPMIKHVDFLDKEYDILKMKFNLGVIELQDIEIRAIGLTFSEVEDNSSPIQNFEIFDNNDNWIDQDDYEEIDMPSIEGYNIEGQILPLLSANYFKYCLDPDFRKSTFGNENSHECCIDVNNIPKTKFNNSIFVDGLRFKWYCDIRNIIFEYISELEFRDAYIYSASYTARRVIKRRLDDYKDLPVSSSSAVPKLNQDKKITRENFEDAMRNIKDGSNHLVPVDHMIIKFSDVQIQLMNSMKSDEVFLLHSLSNEIEIVNIKDENWSKIVNAKALYSRFGTIFESADLVMLTRQNCEKLKTKSTSYGSAGNWPVFLDSSDLDQIGRHNKIFSNVEIILIYEKVKNALHDNTRRNKLFVGVPSFETTINSETYNGFLSIIKDLLMYSAPQRQKFAATTKAFMMANDKNNLVRLFHELENTVDSIHTLFSIQESLELVRYLSNKDLEIDLFLRKRISQLLTGTFLLSKAMLVSTVDSSNISDDHCEMEWLIKAEDFKIDIVDDDNKFLSFAINQVLFTRLEITNGTTLNEVSIKTINILNQDTDILFPELLTEYRPPKKTFPQSNEPRYYDEMILVKWELGYPVGGLRDMKLVNIVCAPIKLSLEDKTGRKLMKFLFPNDNSTDSHFDDSDEEMYGSSDDENVLSETELESNRSSIDGAHASVSSKITRESKRLVPNIIIHKDPTHKDLRLKSCTTDDSSSMLFNWDDENGSNISDLPKIDMDVMAERAENYFNIREFNLNSLTICISFFGRGKFRVINVNDLLLNLPSFRVEDRVWSSVDFVDAIKKFVTKSLLKHTGKLLKNKLFVHRKRKRVNRTK